jgi:hypothetical protein
VAPPSLEYLAALTRRADPSIEIELISASADPEALERVQCDLAAISILTPTAVPGYQIAEKLRARGIKVVFGNMHASPCPKSPWRRRYRRSGIGLAAGLRDFRPVS